jgi:hypothetical protein
MHAGDNSEPEDFSGTRVSLQAIRDTSAPKYRRAFSAVVIRGFFIVN